MKSIALALALIGLCHSTPLLQDAKSAAGAQGAPSAERTYTLALLKTGPKSGKLEKADNDKVFAGHFSNMERMSNEKQLILAGPYGDKRHDDGLRGIFVFDTAKRE